MDDEEKIKNALKKNGLMKSGEIAEATGIGKKQVDKIIKKLKAEDVVESPKRCYYGLK